MMYYSDEFDPNKYEKECEEQYNYAMASEYFQDEDCEDGENNETD